MLLQAISMCSKQNCMRTIVNYSYNFKIKRQHNEPNTDEHI